jgi:hypothetical protein
MYSDRRLKHVAESELYEAVAQLVVLKADESADVAPTDAQIAEHIAARMWVQQGSTKADDADAAEREVGTL